jgi:uncharacterized protein YbjT (DUF2867 family)
MGRPMANDRIAVLVGATRLVGSHCLRRLIQDETYARVVALLRRPIDERHERLDQRVVDFEALPEEALAGATDVFCALGTTIRKAGSQEAFRKVDHGYTLAVAERAARAGARQLLLVSSVGADPGTGNFYLRVKGEVERDVGALPFAAVHVFRPSFLLGERGERRTGEAIGIAVARGLQGALFGGLRKYRPIEAAVVAEAMVGAARGGQPGRHVHHHDEILQLSGR